MFGVHPNSVLLRVDECLSGVLWDIVDELLAIYAMLHPDGQQSIRQPRGRFGFSQRRPGTSQSARHRIAIGWILHSGGLRRSESRSAGVAASRPGTLLHGILVHPFSTPPSYPVPLPDYP